MARARTDQELGILAFHVFSAMSKADMSIDQMKNLGEHIYANSPEDKAAKRPKTDDEFRKQTMDIIKKMKPGTVAKLVQAARVLDAAFPLPEIQEAPPAPVPTPQAAPPAPPTETNGQLRDHGLPGEGATAPAEEKTS